MLDVQRPVGDALAVEHDELLQHPVDVEIGVESHDRCVVRLLDESDQTGIGERHRDIPVATDQPADGKRVVTGIQEPHDTQHAALDSVGASSSTMSRTTIRGV